jgi:hypothetical protein
MHWRRGLTEEIQEQTDILFHSPEGTVIEVAPGFWKVRGKTATYDVNWYEETCDCPSHKHRLKGFGDCKHLTHLREVIKRGPHTCPLCRAEGCESCEGIGRVGADEYPVLLAIREAEDKARVALLKELFA